MRKGGPFWDEFIDNINFENTNSQLITLQTENLRKYYKIHHSTTLTFKNTAGEFRAPKSSRPVILSARNVNVFPGLCCTTLHSGLLGDNGVVPLLQKQKYRSRVVPVTINVIFVQRVRKMGWQRPGRGEYFSNICIPIGRRCTQIGRNIRKEPIEDYFSCFLISFSESESILTPNNKYCCW